MGAVRRILDRVGRRHVFLLLAALAPFVVVWLLPLIGGWQPAVSLPAVIGEESSQAPAILADLSSDLNAIAIAAIVGCAVLFREWRHRDRTAVIWTAGAFVVASAIGSCFAGFRFRFSIAEQIILVPLDLGLIGDRLAAQAVLLLMAISGLLYKALESFMASRHDDAPAVVVPDTGGAADAAEPDPR